jgi:alpha-ribazole phosphatase
MTGTLYLIRHTRPNIAPGICYGQLDIDPAESFVEEANAILNWLPSLDLIITSPLLRTRRLAEHLAQQREVRVDTRLMEKNFGTWEGRAWNDIARCEIDAWAADIMGYAPSGGESAQQVMRRVQSFLRDLAQLPNGHDKTSAPSNKVHHARSPLLNPLPLTCEEANESLREFHVNQNIALVAHGGTIRAILAQIAGVPLTDTLNWKIDYGAVIAVRISRD